MKRRAVAWPTTGLLAFLVTILSLVNPGIANAAAAQFTRCSVQYQVQTEANPEQRIGKHKVSKQISICGKDLADCRRMAPSIVQAREGYASSAPTSDVSSVQVRWVRTDGRCDKLDKSG